MSTKYGWRFILSASILLIFASRVLSETAQVSKELIRSSVDFCRRYEPAEPPRTGFSVHISDDKTILCYDGGIFAFDMPVVNELSNGGIFVIRSLGGLPRSA